MRGWRNWSPALVALDKIGVATLRPERIVELEDNCVRYSSRHHGVIAVLAKTSLQILDDGVTRRFGQGTKCYRLIAQKVPLPKELEPQLRDEHTRHHKDIPSQVQASSRVHANELRVMVSCDMHCC